MKSPRVCRMMAAHCGPLTSFPLRTRSRIAVMNVEPDFSRKNDDALVIPGMAAHPRGRNPGGGGAKRKRRKGKERKGKERKERPQTNRKERK